MNAMQAAVAKMSLPQKLNFANLVRDVYVAKVRNGEAKLDPKHLRMLDTEIKHLRTQLGAH